MVPTKDRNHPSIFISHNKEGILLDCGEGTQRQILRSGLGFKRLNKVLLTHGHLDHILGLAGLLSTLTRWETMDKIEIYGGRSALDRVHDLLFGVVFLGIQPPIELKLLEVNPGLIFDTDAFSVTAFPCWSFFRTYH